MAEAVIIPVQFDISKSAASLVPAQTGLNNLAGAGDKLKNALGGVGNALQNSLASLAKGALVGGAISLIASLAQEFVNAGNKANFFGDAVRGATEKAGAEIFTVQALVAVARDETKSREARSNAVAQLQKQYPDYIKNISLETINSDAAKKAIDGLTNSLFKKAVAQQLANKFAEKQVELLDAQKKLNDEVSTSAGENGFFAKVFQNLKGGGGLTGDLAVLTSASNKVKQLQDELAELKKLGTDALGDSLNFDKTIKPPKELKLKTLKIKADELDLNGALRFGKAQLAVKELEIDPEEIKFKQHSENLPQIGAKNKGLDTVAGDLANANAQIGAGIEDARKLGLIISDTLTPSFTGFTDALFSGADPLKAFFNGLIQSVNQLIDRLIAAALQAAILSALGGGSFGSLFKGALGLSANRVGTAGAGGARGMNINVGGEFVMRGSTAVALVNQGNTQISRVR